MDTSSPSPVPWIAEAIWHNRNNPARGRDHQGAIDAGQELLAQEGSDAFQEWELRRFELGMGSAPSAVLHQVEPERQAAAPVLAVSGRPTEPADMGTLVDEWSERTPAVVSSWNDLSWPVCCERISKLMLLNPTRAELAEVESVVGTLDLILWINGAQIERGLAEVTWIPELQSIRDGGEAENNVLVFQCGACGRLYGEYDHS